MFCDSKKNLLKENDIIKFPRLADTYERIAEEGPDVFYNGSMADSIVNDIQAAGESIHFIVSLQKAAAKAGVLTNYWLRPQGPPARRALDG